MPSPITARTGLVGVLGDPVRHSLSPAMHNAALAAMGMDWVYLALPCRGEDLAAVLRGLEALGCHGLNVTLPHKGAAAALASELSPLAQRIGAVNTLGPRAGGGWIGANTDVEGFLAPLSGGGGSTAQESEWTGREAVVLGCGGSARAVVAALVERGLSRITLAARRAARLETFAADCLPWAPQLATAPWSDADDHASDPSLTRALARAALVVNTTPVGMAAAADPAAADRSPLDAAELDALPAGATVYDLIYSPRPTRLLREASRRGHRVIDGLEMLVQQGAASLRGWSGRSEVPVDAMRRAALAELETRTDTQEG